MKPTNEQEKAIQKIVDFLLDDDERYLVINAIAGAGKSTILTEVLDRYYALTVGNIIYTAKNIEILAPTHKACAVLKNMGLPVSGTIHSHLWLSGAGITWDNSIAIIDESSFIDVYMLQRIQSTWKKVLFIGDSYQLPPIENNFPPVFWCNLPTLSLEHSLRLKPDVLAYCHQLRQAIDAHSTIPTLPNTKSFHHITLDELKANHNPDYPILCLRNSTVNKMNKHVMGRSNIEIGDTVFVTGGNSYDSTLAREVATIHEEVTTYPTYTYGFTNGTCAVIPKYKKDRQQVKRTKPYTTYDIIHTHAMTVHKSQGSTYDGVYIVIDDYLSHRDPEQRLKLLYVAISRSKGDIYVVHR